jgi:hypothetical protein
MATATHHHSKKPPQTAKKAVKPSIPSDFCDAWNQRMDAIGAERCTKARLVAMLKKQ